MHTLACAFFNYLLLSKTPILLSSNLQGDENTSTPVSVIYEVCITCLMSKLTENMYYHVVCAHHFQLS